MDTALVGVGFYHVPVSECRGMAPLGRAAARQQLSVRPVQLAGFLRRLRLAGVCHYVLGVASSSAGALIPRAGNNNTR